MKKTFIIALTCVSIGCFAQSTIQLLDQDNNLVLAPNATLNIATDPVTNFKANIDIKNTSTTTTNRYMVKRYNKVLNAEAVAYFCFAGKCYGSAIQVSEDTLILTPNQSASSVPGLYYTLTADLDEGSVVDTSIIKYSVINVDNHADSIQVTLFYNAHLATVGLKETFKTAGSFEIFPNPAKETTSIRITSPKAFESTLLLYNSLGEVVYQKRISVAEGKSKIDIHMENLPAGVYFASFRAGNSTLSRKLIKN